MDRGTDLFLQAQATSDPGVTSRERMAQVVSSPLWPVVQAFILQRQDEITNLLRSPSQMITIEDVRIQQGRLLELKSLLNLK